MGCPRRRTDQSSNTGEAPAFAGTAPSGLSRAFSESRGAAVSDGVSGESPLSRGSIPGRLLLSALEKGVDRATGLLVKHRQREPVARVADRRAPRQVAPEVQLLLRIAGRLRQLRRQLLDVLVDGGVQL